MSWNAAASNSSNCALWHFDGASAASSSEWPSFSDVPALQELQLQLASASQGSMADLTELDSWVEHADTATNFFQFVQQAETFVPTRKIISLSTSLISWTWWKLFSVVNQAYLDNLPAISAIF